MKRTVLIWLLLLAIPGVVALAQTGGYSYQDGSIAPTPMPSNVGSGSPSIGSCGSGGSLDPASNNLTGLINVGSGLLPTCTVTFSGLTVDHKWCLISSTSLLTIAYTFTSKTLTVSTAVSLGGAKISYICFGGQ